VPQQPLTDIVGLFVFIAAIFFSPDVAAVIGPYMTIIIASSVGGSFALKRRDRTSRAAAMLYFGRVVGLAILLTVGAAFVLNLYYPQLAPRTTIAPIALLIGFIGDDWPALLTRAKSVLFGLLDLWRGKGGQP
jgi:hypothetical protein